MWVGGLVGATEDAPSPAQTHREALQRPLPTDPGAEAALRSDRTGPTGAHKGPRRVAGT